MKALFQQIHQFYIEAECSQPMHVGCGEESSEVLVKHSSGLPFIQGTSIAGAFSSYVETAFGREEQEKYFGSSEKENGITGNRKRKKSNFAGNRRKVRTGYGCGIYCKREFSLFFCLCL